MLPPASTAPPVSDPLSLGVATPERVSLSLPVAGIGSRTGAWLADAGIMFVFWLCVYFVLTFLVDVVDAVQELGAFTGALVVAGIFAMQWVYWTAFEVFWNGQTPGKRLLRIRVVRLDGAPVGFFESTVRNLLRVVDFLPGLYTAGVVTMLVSRHHRRLGDLAAGTLLIRDEQVNLDRYTHRPAHGGGGGGDLVGTSHASSKDTELVLGFLERAPSLDRSARERLSAQLVARLGTDLPEDERARLNADSVAAEQWLRARVQGRQ